MADDIDRANDLAEFERHVNAESLAARAHQAGRADCEDCGEEIPMERRAAYPAASRCFECQREAEAERRLRKY